MPTVREFARLTTRQVPSSLDRASISASAFDWLLRYGRGDGDDFPFVQIASPDTISLQNYVGVIETPCGTQIEILPKHVSETFDVTRTRSLLITMITESVGLKPRRAGNADVAAFNVPMTEWFAGAFLDEASELIRRGLRSGYTTSETREPFLRGRLDVARQIRASGGLHRFSVHLDEYSLNRPENRIMRSAVEHVARNTSSPENWRRARELSTLLGDVPESGNIVADFGRWERGRQLADYARAKPLAELLLDNRLPFATAGDHRGMSMLFPMERLFERYVFSSVAGSLKTGFKAMWQPSRHLLCSLGAEEWFRLKPDMLVLNEARRWIIDAKWKRLNRDRNTNYGLAQSDFYQLFAYGQKYLEGSGDMFLMYPGVDEFPALPGPFEFSRDLRLHVLPFDMHLRAAPTWLSVIGSYDNQESAA
ncbi:McrC family protein [Rhizobium laguerreae]|uniref:McrC family protein n=1 Tax=Rhizobium laguerreae TaxID=1076926 RepID=UPI001C91FAA2|nr:McrC family protein [Rhizobium laguerreae]MBY3307519.1 McrC family protein [Rhizobium laguerreae]